ncbi:MAG: ATP-dependent helicase [Gammaproteobacteria bacterium]|nr:ATP-dependent helicase [Gammaproteobacteria bacterium]
MHGERLAAPEPADQAPEPDPFAQLNAAQREAACHGHSSADGVAAGPLLIIAGAGTGKTGTLAHRVAHLVLAGHAGERILLLTFSRRAAVEMGDRARRIVGHALRAARGGDSAVRLPWSGTFHGVANRLLREYAANVGLEASFSVLDRGDAADLLDVARHELGYSRLQRRFPRKETCLDVYSRTVNAQAPLAEVLTRHFPFCAEWEAELRQLFRRYVALKLEAQLLDYDDLLLYWYHLMGEPSLASAVSARFDHVLVDEYQDTNRLQAGIVKALRPDGRGVTVVGDDAQSIYAFRAASIDNILDFPQQYTPQANIVRLEQNYRSTQAILDSANALMAEASRQYGKRLWSARAGGAMPRYVTLEDDAAQIDYVVREVLAAREAGVALRRQAVLFRNGHHSDGLELELIRRNIPYVKYGGLKFLEAAHVKDLLSLLRLAENPKNRLALFRVAQLLPGMGPANAERAHDWLASHDWRLASLAQFAAPAQAREDWLSLAALLVELSRPDAALLDAWHSQVGQARRWYEPQLERLYAGAHVRAGDLDQLEHIATRYPTRERFLSELTLDPPQASSDLSGAPLIDEDFLVLSTVHSAKGQEWDAVFVLNVADGNFPNEFATGVPEMIEEERRLLYVAMTRARSDLHLLAPLKYYVTGQRRHGDRHVYGARSRFVTEPVMGTFERVFHSIAESGGHGAGARPNVSVDVASRLREQW